MASGFLFLYPSVVTRPSPVRRLPANPKGDAIDGNVGVVVAPPAGEVADESWEGARQSEQEPHRAVSQPFKTEPRLDGEPDAHLGVGGYQREAGAEPGKGTPTPGQEEV
jgi:hypothetical protein